MKVILLTLHGARLDAFGTYGGTLTATPHFDAFASQSIVFDQHFASRLFTNTDAESEEDQRFVTLDELTAELTNNDGSSAYFADQRVMQSLSYSASWKHVTLVTERDLAAMEQPTLSDGVLQHGIDWLQQYGHHYDRWLLNLELGALLPPWREEEIAAAKETGADEESAEPVLEYEVTGGVPDERRFGWRAAYAGVVRYLDDLLGQFVKLLDELELTGQCLFIIQSSEGQPLGEYRPGTGSHQGIEEARHHLPLMIRFPQGAGAGRRVHHFTHPEDVLATIYQCLLGQAPAELPGDHLVRYTQGSAGRYRDYAVTELFDDKEQLLEAALRTQYWNAVIPLDDNERAMQLFRKPEDRWDMNNVTSEHADVVEHLELTLRRYLAWKTAGRHGDAPALRDELVKVLAR